MMSSTDMRQRAMALLDQRPHTKLVAVVQLLEVLAEPISPPSASQPSDDPEEARWLTVIERPLADFDQAHLEDLRERCEWGELSEAEHQELIDYEDRLEQDRAGQLEALMNLAKLSPGLEVPGSKSKSSEEDWDLSSLVCLSRLLR